MAKKKQDANIAQATVANMLQAYGGYTVDEIRKNLRGIPMNNFALEWGLDSNVWYLGFIYMLVGEWGSGKTQLLFQIFERFLDHDPKSIAFFIPTEGKDAPTQAESLLGEYASCGRFAVVPAALMGKFEAMKKKSTADLAGEAWNNIIYNLVEELREYPHPVIIGLDSLLGAPTESTVQAIEEAKGSIGGRNTLGMERASELNLWMPWMSSRIAGTKITFVFTNHGKPKVEMGPNYSRGQIDKHWPGGDQVSSRPNSIVYMTKGASMKGKEYSGSTSWIKMYKNSNGDSGRLISVDHFYRVMRDAEGEAVLDANGHPVRELVWDWDQSACDVLASFFQEGLKDSNGPASYRKEIKMVKTGTSVNPLYTIEAWGLKGVTPSEVAQFLRADSEESEAARRRLMKFDKVHVVHNTVYQPE